MNRVEVFHVLAGLVKEARYIGPLTGSLIMLKITIGYFKKELDRPV